ncbi:hypothetical protein NERG_00712 [Nematocida ausubeli]|uniref:Uncharacterized protein n=1 Tax=Nematocida ausubeli (strain ATCC PRA-371 / ERTm2) TaxID=1913371 RepID=H8ZAW3_NEMA1|nr:hypothetical protein NERG_00712 [Nematocida ausubeli]
MENSPENALRTGLDALDAVTERISIVNQIVDSMRELHQIDQPQKNQEISEEYYLFELNKWITISAHQSTELEMKNELLLVTQKKYLESLKKLKFLQTEVEAVNEKYKYYKEQAEQLKRTRNISVGN